MANKNLSLDALKSHLFETLEGVKNLSDDKASACEKISIEQAKQIVDIADSIIDIYKTQVDALKVCAGMDNINSTAAMMEGMGLVSQEERKLISD